MNDREIFTQYNMENIITTNRLLLTPMNENVIDFIFMLETQFESYQYDSDNTPTYDAVIKRCQWYIDRTQSLPDDGAIRWIVRKNNIMIGEVHFTCNYDRTHEWEIGYKFLKEHWGNGFASESVRAVIQYAFENFNVNRIVAFLNAENKRSAALCERVGMVKEGRLREVRLINGVYYDEYIFSVLKRKI
jgi:ribosomal-protein-alanine N-acetyltransferase